MNYVKFHGEKIPIYNTPISHGEIQKFREEHDKFLIKDVRHGSVKLITNSIEIKRFRIDFGFRPMVYTTALVLAFYNYLQVKKKVKKVKGKMPFSWGGSITEFMKKEVKPNGTKPIAL
jgi:hypothetical protein